MFPALASAVMNKRYAGAFFGAMSKELYGALEGDPADMGYAVGSGSGERACAGVQWVV